MEQILKSAITERRLVEFSYGGHRRIAEPHVLGVCGGVTQLLVYQVGGASRSGGIPEWRRFDLDKISGLKMLRRPFPGARPIPSGKHSAWDERIAFVA